MFGTILSVVGSFFGPIGFIVGNLLGSLLFKPSDITTEGNKIEEFSVQQSRVGNPIPILRGEVKVGGNVIWHRGFEEHSRRIKVADGGKGGSDQYVTEYYYSNKIALALSRNELAGFKRIWFDKKLAYSYDGNDRDEYVGKFSNYFLNQTLNQKGDIRKDEPDTPSFGGLFPIFVKNMAKEETNEKDWRVKFYSGSEDQEIDKFIEESEGSKSTPFKGISYMLFEFFDLTDWGHRIPKIDVSVVEKGFDDSVEVIDSNDNITITSNKITTCDYNFYEPYKYIHNQAIRETAEYSYAVLRLTGNPIANKRDVNIYNSNYIYENEVIDSNTSFYNLDYDTRLHIEKDDLVMLNGEREIRFNKDGFTKSTIDYDFSTTAEGRSSYHGSYTKIEENSYIRRKNGNVPVVGYVNTIDTGMRSGSVIASTDEYKVIFIYNKTDYYNSEDYRPETKDGYNTLLVETKIDSFYVSKIEGRDIMGYFEYNNTSPIIYTFDNLTNEIIIYMMGFYYDQNSKSYNYKYSEINRIKTSSFYFRNIGSAGKDYQAGTTRFEVFVENNNENVVFNKFGIPSVRSRGNYKLYYDPRFNVFINIEEFSKHDGTNIKHILNIYSINNNNNLDKIKEEDVVLIESTSSLSNIETFTTSISFNRGLNIISLYNNEDSKLVIDETQISYFKDSEIVRDFETHLDEVVEDLLLDSTYSKDDIDVSELRNIVLTGYVYGKNDNARSHIDKLRMAFQFDIIEEDFKIKAKIRGKDYVRIFKSNEIGFNSDNDYSNSVDYNMNIASSIELPTNITLNYNSIEDGLEPSSQKSEIVANHNKDEVIDLPIVLFNDQAKQICDINLTVAHRETEIYDFNVSLENIDLNVSDIIVLETIEDDEVIEKYLRIADIDLNEYYINIKAVSDSSNSYRSNKKGTVNNGGIKQVKEVDAKSDLLMFTAPALLDELYTSGKPNVYSISLPKVNKSTELVFYNSRDKDLISEEDPQRLRSIGWGNIVSDNTKNNDGFDTSEIKFKFVNDYILRNQTKKKLFEDKRLNLVAIINKNNIEFIQYKNYSVDGDIYILTNLLRGRFNTYSDDIFTDSIIVFLDETRILSNSYDLNRLNTTQYGKLLSKEQELEDVNFEEVKIDGRNLEPFSITDLDVDINENNVIIKYSPIVNIDGGWNDNSDVDYSYLSFVINLFDSNDDILETIETEDIVHTYDNTNNLNIDYITVTSKNKEYDLYGRPVSFDMNEANVI